VLTLARDFPEFDFLKLRIDFPDRLGPGGKKPAARTVFSYIRIGRFEEVFDKPLF